MAYTRDSGTQNKRVKRAKKPVRMTPHSPGGQRLRPAPVSHPKPRTPAAKRQGVRVIQRAATPTHNVPHGPGGQRVRKTPDTNYRPRTKAEKKQGVKVIQKAAHVHPKKHGSGLFNFAASTLASSLPGPLHAIGQAAAPKAGKIIENSAREAIDIPANIVPSTYHIAEPLVKSKKFKTPFFPDIIAKEGKAYTKTAKRTGEAVISLPKEYVKAYQKKGIKGAEDVLVKHPLSTALTVAPIPRGPGLVAGGVARRLGKMPHIEPRVLPETAMKEAVPRSKSYFKAKRQAKKGGQVEDKHIERRVDEQVALMEDLTRRTQASTYRKAYKARKKVVSKKQARQEAAELALKEQNKTRTIQKQAITEGMALVKKPKYSQGHLIEQGGQGPQVFKDRTAAEGVANRYTNQHGIKMVPVQHPGGYAVMPESAVKRLKQHEANTEVGPMGAMAKAYNTVWRKNVLATHPTWYAGNTIEAAIRSLASGVGPTSYIRGYKALGELKRMDPKAHAEMTGHATKGGHLAMQAHLPEETRIDITGANTLAKTARAVQGLRDKPGIRQVADGWNHVTDFAMGTLSGKAESAFQTGMLGKELARNPLMDGHILKTSKAAIEDAAKGMRETHNQVALGQAIDRMYGQYGKFSPGRRKMIAHYTPFIAWTLNSLNWLYRYLPADHPVLTATAASVQPYVDQWLKDKGLSAFVHGALPSFLRGSIPTKHGFARFPTRYSPFAIAAGAPEDLAGTVLPQFKGAIDILQHQINWKGQKLKNPDGSPLDPNQLGVMAGLTLLEGMIPASQQFIGVSDRYEKGARTPRKLVKPKSSGDIGKAFNPLTTVKSPSKKSKSNSLLDTGPSRKQKSLLDSPAKSDVKSLLDSP